MPCMLMHFLNTASESRTPTIPKFHHSVHPTQGSAGMVCHWKRILPYARCIRSHGRSVEGEKLKTKTMTVKKEHRQQKDPIWIPPRLQRVWMSLEDHTQ